MWWDGSAQFLVLVKEFTIVHPSSSSGSCTTTPKHNTYNTNISDPLHKNLYIYNKNQLTPLAWLPVSLQEFPFHSICRIWQNQYNDTYILTMCVCVCEGWLTVWHQNETLEWATWRQPFMITWFTVTIACHITWLNAYKMASTVLVSRTFSTFHAPYRTTVCCQMLTLSMVEFNDNMNCVCCVCVL